jgi:hypothetical protein
MWKRGLKLRSNTIIFLVALLVAVVSWIATLANRDSVVDPHVKIEQKPEEDLRAKLLALSIGSTMRTMTGEVSATSFRLRDACAATLAAMMATVASRSANNVTQQMVDNRLLPPGMTRTNERQLDTQLDTLLVRTQLQPLQIEVVSLAKDKRFGPGLVVRLMEEGTQFWMSKTVDNVVLPPPFLANQQLLGMGWRQEELAAAKDVKQ